MHASCQTVSVACMHLSRDKSLPNGAAQTEGPPAATSNALSETHSTKARGEPDVGDAQKETTHRLLRLNFTFHIPQKSTLVCRKRVGLHSEKIPVRSQSRFLPKTSPLAPDKYPFVM